MRFAFASSARFLPALLLICGCSSNEGVTTPTDGGVDGAATLDSSPIPDVAQPPPPATGFPVPFDQGVTYTGAIFVGPTGSDTTGTGTRASPFATVGRALQARTAGVEIVLLAGTYAPPGHLGSPQGTATQPIKIRGEGTVVITGSGVGLSMTDPRYVVLENLVVDGVPIHGMNLDDGGSYATPGEHVVLRRITFRNVGSGGNNDCLKMSGIDRFYVTQSDFSGCNLGEAIDMVGCHDGVITGNSFHDMPGTGVQAKGGSRDVLIHGNLFLNVAVHAINLGGSTGDPYVRPLAAPFEGERIVAMSNVIQGSLAPVAFLGCGSCLVANNTIVAPTRWVFRVLQGSRDNSIIASRDGFFVNNVVHYRRATISTVANVGPNTVPASFTLGNNLYFATDGTAFDGLHSGTGLPPETGSVLQQDPGFVNAAGADFRLVPNSPARGKGRALPYGALFDFAAQLPNAPPDLGAHKVL